MKTTLHIRDDLLHAAARLAAAQGRTLDSLVEEGLAHILIEPLGKDRRSRITLPVSRAGGGVYPGIDLNASSDLEEAMNAC